MCVVVTLQGIDVEDEEESEKDLKLTFEDYDEKEIEIMLKQIHRERFANFQHHSLQRRIMLFRLLGVLLLNCSRRTHRRRLLTSCKRLNDEWRKST